MVLHIVIRPMSFVEFLKALDWVLYFLTFSLMIFLVVEKSDICNFTLYFHGSSLPLILNNPEHDMRNLLYSLKINSLKANPGKFQFMILGKKKRLKYSLKIGSITIKESDEVELLRITIDNALNFRKTSKIYVAVPSTNFML